MKKISSLAEQVQKAQKTFNSWPESKKFDVRLEGNNGFSRRYNTSQNGAATLNGSSKSPK